MRQKELEKWLKIVIIAVALCGLVVCAVAIPWIGHVLIASDPQISDMYIPWLVMFIISAIPCYVILYLGWRVAVNIGKDRSFSLENARHIKLASKIILFDALYFFVVNVCMWRIYVNHPGVILALVFIVFACVVASVVAAVLSHLVVKAADLQEQSDERERYMEGEIIFNIDVMLAKRKMSVTELSQRVGITMANISILKNGRAKAIKVSTLAKLCEALDCQPGDLLEYRDCSCDKGKNIVS